MEKYTLVSKESGFTSFQEGGKPHKVVALSELEDGLSFLLYALNGTAQESLGCSEKEALSSAKAWLLAGVESLEEVEV